MILLTFVLFLFLLFGGIVIAYFSYNIYTKTKGGSRGWAYLAICGIVLGIYSFNDSISLMINIPPIQNIQKLILDGVSYFLLNLFMCLGVIELIEGFGLKKSKFLNKKFFLILFSLIVIVLFTYNLITPNFGFLPESVSITISLFLFTFPFSFYGFYVLWKNTKLLAWFLILISTIFLFFGSFSEQVCANSCTWEYNKVLIKEKPLGYVGIPECEGFASDMVFAEAIPLGNAFDFLVPIANYNDVFWLIAIILIIIGFFLIWKSMKK